MTRGVRLTFAALALAGCATPVMTSHGGRVTRTGWALLPMANYSEAPLADERVRAVLATVLRARGLQNLREGPSLRPDPVPELDQARRTAAALDWARKEGLAFGITGSVNEWRYRGAGEGWPAVGLTLTVFEVKTGDVLWTTSGALGGGSGDTASGTAQRLLERLLAGLELK